MICFAFPLAHEARTFLKGCTQRESFAIGALSCTMANLRTRRILVAKIGMGAERAASSAEIIFEHFRPHALILAGYGGALVPQLKIGQVVISQNYTSESVLGFLRLLSGFDFAAFYTSDELIDTPEKRELCARQYQCQVVDMETAAVATVAESHEVPFVAVRAISDDFPQSVPSGALAAGIDAGKGEATPFRLLCYLVLHGQEISPLQRFIAGLSIARRNLTTFLRLLNEELPASW